MSTASSPDGNSLDSGATFSLLLSPTILRSNLSPPTTFSLSPFLHAGRLTLIFTSPHDLLVEDNLSDSTVLSEQQSQLTSYQRRKVGLSEKEREWPIGSQSSYSGDSPVQRNTTGSPAPATVTAQSSHHQRPMFSKSRTTLAYESITHTSTINSTHATYGEAYHASTYGRTKLLAEHAKHVHSSRDSQRNSNPNLSHNSQHHCESCYDYDPSRCRSAAVIALFAYIIVSHDNSTVTSNRHPTLDG